MFLQAVSRICRSGSALNTCFKRCFPIPTAISTVPEPGRLIHGLEAAKCYHIHVRSFVHRFPYCCLIPCLRSKVTVSEGRRLMQEKLWIAGGDAYIAFYTVCHMVDDTLLAE